MKQRKGGKENCQATATRDEAFLTTDTWIFGNWKKTDMKV